MSSQEIISCGKNWFLVTRIDFFWQELISFDKNWFLVTRNDFLWQELISCGKNSFLMTIIDFLWQELSSFHKNQFFSWTFKINKTLPIHKIRLYKARAGPWITLSQAKYWSRKWGSHEAKYFLPPWSGSVLEGLEEYWRIWEGPVGSLRVLECIGGSGESWGVQ